ncbi:MAG: Flp pilus assembly complex ATPase component TadA [Magnetococcales bacterium]|nr:Flp pilus assembly complex ATPase component TadA [Magnetococcales bacterium]
MSAAFTSPRHAQPRRLGELLLDASLITSDQLHIALAEQKKTGELLGRILTRLEFVPEALLRDLLGDLLGVPVVDLDQTVIDPRILALVPKKLIERHQVLPIRWSPKEAILTLAMADPRDMAVLDAIQANIHTEINLKSVLSGPGEIARAIGRAFHPSNAPAVNPRVVADDPIRLIDALLVDAARQEATHIHIEPEPGQVSIRYRHHGVMSQRCALHRDHLSGMLSRIRQLAGMENDPNGASRQGRFRAQLSGMEIDCQVTALATMPDESLVLRVRKGFLSSPTLESLGLALPIAERLKGMLVHPTGLTMIAAPPGGGLSTTLRALMAYLQDEEISLISIEEHPEHPRHAARRVTGGEWLSDPLADPRELLDMDADILFLDAVRAPEAMRAALRAAMRGQRIVAGIHAHSAHGVFQRLIDMELPIPALIDNLTGVVAQRLVRLLCPACKSAHPPLPEEKRVLGARIPDTLFSARGCPACQHSGYHGRVALFEALPADAPVSLWLEGGARHSAFIPCFHAHELPTLADDALRRVRQGEISLEEAARVVHLDSHSH